MEAEGSATRRFSPHASLAAIGLRLQELKLIDLFDQKVKISQKKLKFSPAEKLYDAFITILAGAHGLNELTTRLHSDEALQRAFGGTSCAEYSVVQDTLDATTFENVAQLQQVLNAIFQRHSQGHSITIAALCSCSTSTCPACHAAPKPRCRPGDTSRNRASATAANSGV